MPERMRAVDGKQEIYLEWPNIKSSCTSYNSYRKLKLIIHNMHCVVTVTDGAKNGLLLLSECTCIEYTITFECTVLSGFGGATVWKGSAFDCARSDNEVVLLHSPIESNEHKLRTCNNGSSYYWRNNSGCGKLLHFTAPCNGQS